MNELDQIIKLRIIQLERIASILFFLLPLIILLVIGKTFANYILYLWQGYCLLYILLYRYTIRKLSNHHEKIMILRYREYNRFYRLSWAYIVLSVLFMIGYYFYSN